MFDRITDEERGPHPRTAGPAKSALNRMLAKAVVNTGGKPVAKTSSPQPAAALPEFAPSMTLTADDVAIAIIAASKETGANPIDVASGVLAIGGRYASRLEVSRARAYAAVAIRAVFSDCSQAAISRSVGHRSPQVYMSALDHQLRNKTMKWWDDAVFMRVVEAIEAHGRDAS